MGAPGHGASVKSARCWISTSTSHQSTNIVIEGVSATEARVTNDMLVFEVADVPYLMATGRCNRSVVVDIAKGCKFKRRTPDIDSGFFRAMEKNQAPA